MSRTFTILILYTLLNTAYTDDVLSVGTCQICDALNRYIPDVGGSYVSEGVVDCDAQACQRSNKFSVLWNHTNAVLASSDGGPAFRLGETGDMLFDVNNTNNVAETLVWALLGRQIVSTLGKDTPLDPLPLVFQYNVVSQRLEVSHPACMYEKSFYMALLVACVLIIVTALALRAIQTMPPASPSAPHATAPVVTQPSSTVKAPAMRFGATQGTPSSDFRYRVLAQSE